MASLFASQLAQIAAVSTNELDLKAQKAVHAESLLFERKVAGGQEFDIIYQICLEGFQDLCRLDARFDDFEQTLFSAQSKSQDRTHMTALENQALDVVLERFLILVGSRLLLRPALKALEWLVRRFKVHRYNTSTLLSTFLPYHETPVFQNVLSILPSTVPIEYRFLSPYLKTATNPPRHAIAYSATNSDPFFNAFSAYTIRVCQHGAAYSALLSFWGSIVIEAVSGRLALAQSGRKEVQRQRQDDVLRHLLPLLQEGFAVQDVPEVTLACYTVSMILADKSALHDKVLGSLMDGVAATVRPTTTESAVLCLVILSTRREDFVASENLVSLVAKDSAFTAALLEVSQRYPVDNLTRALVRGCLRDLSGKRKVRHSRIALMERLIRGSELDLHLATSIFQDIIAGILALRQQPGAPTEPVFALTEMVRKFGDASEFSETITDAVRQMRARTADVEAVLGHVVEPPSWSLEAIPAPMEVDVEDDETAADQLAAAFKHLPERTATEHSFLVPTESHLFEQLRDVFRMCCDDKSGLAKFQSLSLWQSTADGQSALYISFLLKVACGPYLARVRATALLLMAQDATRQKKALDGQALLPYLAVSLTSTAQNVRRAAAEVISALRLKSSTHLVEGEEVLQWGRDTLYESARMVDVAWVPVEDATKLLDQLFVSSLEECILDHTHMGRVITSALNGNSDGPRTGPNADLVHLKRSLRHALFNLLTSHLIVTPLYAVKSELVLLLAHVEKVGSTNKSKALMPVLEAWASLHQELAAQIAASQGLKVLDIDVRLTEIISARDREILAHLKSTLAQAAMGQRSGLVGTIFARLVAVWKDLKPAVQIAVSRYLFESSHTNDHLLSRPARETLLSVSLPTEALVNTLEDATRVVKDLADQPPPNKRRRTSHGQTSRPLDMTGRTLEDHCSDMTFALEVIDNSDVKNHPELLTSLSRTLGLLKTLRNHAWTPTTYLLHLCLGNMLAIVKSARSVGGKQTELSTIPAALVTDCVRSAENPQVQSTALLLAAELAAIAPDSVLHHLMPIFTFMGKRVLSKDDDHSINVVNSVIDHIIPPMVRSLVKQKTDITEGTAELLVSFCSAFHDVPQSRRLALFRRLVYAIGPEDILHAVVSRLLIRDRNATEVEGFVMTLMNEFPPHVQLRTITKILAHIQALLQHPDDVSKIVFDIRDTNDEAKQQAITKLLTVIQDLLESSGLKTRIAKAFSTNKSIAGGDVALTLRSDIGANVTQLLTLLQTHRGLAPVSTALQSCLTALFDLVPFSEYFRYVLDFLQEEHVEWRVRVLQMLNTRLHAKAHQDRDGREAAIDFLSRIVSHVESEADVGVRHAAMASVDSIIEHYGRKSPDEIMTVAGSILHSDAINKDHVLQTAVTLCLSTVVETLKEGTIPILPALMSKAMQMLERSMIEDQEDEKLHNAAYTLLSGLLTHVPFMFAEEHLDRLLSLSAESANAEMPGDCEQTRQDTLSLVARKIQLSAIVASVSRTWTTTVENGSIAVGELLDLVGQSIDNTAKSAVVRAAELVSSTMLQMLDLRRVQLTDRSEDSYNEEEITAIENGTNAVIIKFIYKLNDTVFRPLFSTWVDWAVRCSGVKPSQLSQARILRRTTLFRFMAHFFATLTSIVTSYTSYVLEPAISTLAAMHSATPSRPSPAERLSEDELISWTSTLVMLRESATYDQDSFYSSSTHFQSLASTLTSQLELASTKSLQPHVTTHVISAIVALISSVADNASHHATINHSICQLRHSEYAAVRLMSVKTQQALSESEDVGEEWVNNLVAQGGEVMVYVNEMLEDDDEEVEREVRAWVRKVREMVGEDVFEA